MVWDEWSKQLVKRRKLRSAILRWQGRLLQQALSQWLGYVDQSRSKRGSIAKVCLYPVTSQRLCNRHLVDMDCHCTGPMLLHRFPVHTLRVTGLLPSVD